MEQREAPYTRMGYFSNMLRGLPLQQTSQFATPAQPSTLNQIVGLGTAAAGLGKLFARGGTVEDDVANAGLQDLMMAQIRGGAR
jgi:hypothetical protein